MFHENLMSNNFRKTAVLKKNMNRKLLKIRATFRPHSAEVTANSNTLDVFQYKTNNNKDGRSYTSVYNHSYAPQSFTNIAGS